MQMHRFRTAATSFNFLWKAVIATAFAMACAAGAVAQAPAAEGAAVTAPSAQELDKLVGRIALYPDDLVAIILPASTNPLQLVQADRFLDKRKTDPTLSVNETWDDAVKSLLNYPEVVKLMSNDLDWTTALGEAVVADLGAVMDAIQSFRRRAQSAGNLKTDDKQAVVVEKEVIKVVPANPEVVYVPQYNPSTVVVYSSTPAYGYWPAPYPSYYYPYPPGAALATGLVWGAAIGAAWGGGHYDCDWEGNNNININRETNINRERNVTRADNANRGGGNRGSQGGSRSSSATAWKSNKQPGQVSGATGRPAGARAGDARSGSVRDGSPSTSRAAASPSDRAGAAGNVSAARDTRGSSNASRRDQSGGRYGDSRDAFGGYSSGRQTQLDSARGAASRGTMSGGRGGFSGSRGGGGRGGGRR
jgi:hypothetical protein